MTFPTKEDIAAIVYGGSVDYKLARKMFDPTDLPAVKASVVSINRPPASAERTHIEKKIAEHERQIAQHAQQIRWLRLELEGL